MTNRETNTKNIAIATLTSPMGDTDLTITVDSTTTLPASPCYLVLNPDDDTRREVVYADGTFTSTTVVLSSLANRYLDGSAAGSGLTHASGASVAHVSGLSQLWEDINDRVDAASDHGGLSGLADDDHTQYALVSGTRTISVSATEPSSPATGDLWVDTA